MGQTKCYAGYCFFWGTRQLPTCVSGGGVVAELGRMKVLQFILPAHTGNQRGQKSNVIVQFSTHRLVS